MSCDGSYTHGISNNKYFSILQVDQISALYSACEFGHTLVVGVLVERGADVNLPMNVSACLLFITRRPFSYNVEIAILSLTVYIYICTSFDIIFSGRGFI